ncbi:MAG TPA: hypothetical protein VF677_01965 [Flavobacterium sp.]|jgi:hypothetical protein
MDQGGKIIRNIFGPSFKEAETIQLRATKGNLDFITPKEANFHGKQGGKKFGEYEEGPVETKADNTKATKAEVTRVKEIERLTPLDYGSNNDGKGKTQEGIVFGKTYKFKVKTYTNGEPKLKSSIKWMYKYHNLTQNKWVEVYSKVTGDNYTIHFNEEEMCGRFVYIRAYIEDEKSEGELKIWKHNRFRWFDRTILEEEIKARTDDKKPWRINQSGTSLCGMACIFYLFAKEQPDAYKKFAKKLFRTGEATHNKYTAKPSVEVLEKMPYVNGILNEKEFPWNWVNINGRNQKVNMPLIDYITMAGTRNTDNPDYKGGDEEFQAINWPPLMTKLCEDLLGYGDVVSHGIYNPIKRGTNYPLKLIYKIIEDINQQLSDGYKIILMIDSDLIDDDPDFYVPKKINLDEIIKSAKSPFEFDYHWVTLETFIRDYPWLDSKGQNLYKLDFKVYSWGSKTTYLKEQITLTHFINNFYGYIKVK